jgi:uncharacterized protein YjbI with pentapeptide repeats
MFSGWGGIDTPLLLRVGHQGYRGIFFCHRRRFLVGRGYFLCREWGFGGVSTLQNAPLTAVFDGSDHPNAQILAVVTEPVPSRCLPCNAGVGPYPHHAANDTSTFREAIEARLLCGYTRPHQPYFLRRPMNHLLNFNRLALLLCVPISLSGCIFEGDDCGPPANLVPNAQLQSCDLASFIDNELQGANLVGANLNNANAAGLSFAFADLTNADLRNTNISGGDLGFAKLINADLTGAELTGASIGLADFTNADFSRTDLVGADFFGCNLTGAVGSPNGADLADFSNTTCPNGVNSDDAGDTCVGQGF